MELARENFSHQIRAIESFLRSPFPPPSKPLSSVSTRERYGSNLKMDMVFFVPGHFEDEKVRPFDLSVHHLTVQVVDVRHPEISGEILIVRKPHIAFDAPFTLLHGDARISLDDFVLGRLSVPVMNETHVGVIQRVVDVVEVIADAIQTHHIQANLRTFKLRVSWEGGWVTPCKRKSSLDIPPRDNSGFGFCPQMVSALPAAPRIDRSRRISNHDRSNEDSLLRPIPPTAAGAGAG